MNQNTTYKTATQESLENGSDLDLQSSALRLLVTAWQQDQARKATWRERTKRIFMNLNYVLMSYPATLVKYIRNHLGATL